MKMNRTEYKVYADTFAPKSKMWLGLIKSFVIGGAICALGQAISNGYLYFGFTKDTAGTLTSISLIFISALLTSLGVYDKIAKHGGAGTLVPITGFANAVVSAAMEFRAEGFILGVGAKIFTIAGPVILYGTVASVAAGIVYFLL